MNLKFPFFEQNEKLPSIQLFFGRTTSRTMSSIKIAFRILVLSILASVNHIISLLLILMAYTPLLIFLFFLSLI